MRDPAIAALVAGIYGRLRSRVAAIAARAQDQGQLPGHADPQHLGAVLLGLVQGYMLQRLLLGDAADGAGYRRAVGALLTAGTPTRSGYW